MSAVDADVLPARATDSTAADVAPPPESTMRLRSVRPAPQRLTPTQAFEQGGALAASLARRFARFGADFDDCLSTAHVALVASSTTWLPSGGASFLTWAVIAMRSALGRMLTRERRRGLTGGRGGKRGTRGAARALGFSIGRTSSMDQTIDDGDQRSLHDVLGTAAEQEDAACEAQVTAKIRAAVERMSERDRTIWALSNEGTGTVAIGERVGMTGSSVSRRLAKISDEMQTLIETGRKGTAGHDERDNRSRHLTHDGLTMSLPAWARRLGIPARVLRVRLAQGWSVYEALAIPKRAARPGQGRRAA